MARVRYVLKCNQACLLYFESVFEMLKRKQTQLTPKKLLGWKIPARFERRNKLTIEEAKTAKFRGKQ